MAKATATKEPTDEDYAFWGAETRDLILSMRPHEWRRFQKEAMKRPGQQDELGQKALEAIQEGLAIIAATLDPDIYARCVRDDLAPVEADAHLCALVRWAIARREAQRPGYIERPHCMQRAERAYKSGPSVSGPSA